MRKRLVVLIFLGLFCSILLVLASNFTSTTSVGLNTITQDAPCPVVGCSDGDCHDITNIPEDENQLMVCPEVGCSENGCHGWEKLFYHYRQVDTASLNIWIMLPVLTACIVILIRKKEK